MQIWIKITLKIEFTSDFILMNSTSNDSWAQIHGPRQRNFPLPCVHVQYSDCSYSYEHRCTFSFLNLCLMFITPKVSIGIC